MIRPLAIVVVLLLASGHVLAQQRIVALLYQDRYTTEIWEARVEGGQLFEVRLRRVTGGSAVTVPTFTAGGQFVVWNARPMAWGPLSTLALDRTTGNIYGLMGLEPIVSDPSRTRLFASVGNEIASVTTARQLMVLPGTVGLVPAAVSYDGSRVYARRILEAGPPPVHELVTVDAESGAALAAFPVGVNAGSVSPADDDDSVWVISARATAPDLPLLRNFLSPSGQERLAIPLSPSVPSTQDLRWIVGVDGPRRRVAVSEWKESGSAVAIYDTESGARVGGIETGGWLNALLDRGTGQLVALCQAALAAEAVLHTISADTGQELSRVGLGTTSLLINVAFATPPRPPVLNTPAVSSSRTVTLSWSRAPELTLSFTVEAGSGPGLSNLAVLPVTDGTTLTVPNVPPGTYYVRVRAWDYVGASVPSNEVGVEVR